MNQYKRTVNEMLQNRKISLICKLTLGKRLDERVMFDIGKNKIFFRSYAIIQCHLAANINARKRRVLRTFLLVKGSLCII